VANPGFQLSYGASRMELSSANEACYTAKLITSVRGMFL
jgi:hypothetical protein